MAPFTELREKCSFPCMSMGYTLDTNMYTQKCENYTLPLIGFFLGLLVSLNLVINTLLFSC